MIILYTEFRSTYMEVQVGILGLFTTNRCEKKGKKTLRARLRVRHGSCESTLVVDDVIGQIGWSFFVFNQFVN